MEVMTEDNKRIEEQLYEQLRWSCEESRKIDYNPGFFWKMLNERGPVLTCKKLLEGGPDSLPDGFVTLLMKKRLDLSMEVIVLEPIFASLFDRTELATARKRLENAGYRITSPA